MLMERNVVGKQEDWARTITMVDDHEHPLVEQLPVGAKMVRVRHEYMMDSYEAPTDNSWVDGKDWDQFSTAGRNRKQATANGQWLVKTAAVSKLGEDVSNVKAVASELAREITKKMKEMQRDFEAAISCDQEARSDDGANGNKTRGIGNWIQAGAQTVYPVDATHRPPAASIYSGTKADLNEAAVKAVLQSMWQQTGVGGRINGIVGPSLKSRFADFQFYVPTSISTQGTARVTQRGAKDELANLVDVYSSDFGTLSLELSNWLINANLGGTAGKAAWRGYFLHLKKRWSLRWAQKPKVYKPEFKGGGYKAAMDMIAMLVCDSPLGEGKVDPSDA